MFKSWKSIANRLMGWRPIDEAPIQVDVLMFVPDTTPITGLPRVGDGMEIGWAKMHDSWTAAGYATHWRRLPKGPLGVPRALPAGEKSP